VKILDVCCGGRMMWFDKHNKDTVYCDFSIRPKGVIEQQPNFCVNPDIMCDFRALPFSDNMFSMVVFDPPHVKNVDLFSITGKKYGSIDSISWENDLACAFRECWRVLSPDGFLIFKWGEVSISVADVLRCFEKQPLFGHPTAKSGKTKWICFMKEA
jgi:ubiquinone/menaquinone biosynthesis C-methylase UbiE